jgi:hypothetical protein
VVTRRHSCCAAPFSEEETDHGFHPIPHLQNHRRLAVLAMPDRVVRKSGPVGKPSGGGAAIDWQLSVSGHEASS